MIDGFGLCPLIRSEGGMVMECVGIKSGALLVGKATVESW